MGLSTDLPDLPSKFPPNCETPTSRFSDVNSFTLSISSRSISPQICQTQNTDQYSDQDIIPRNIESVPITSALNCSNPNNLRTNDQLIAQRAFDLPDGLPSGPWFDSDIAKIELNQWEYKFTSGGGCFKLIWGSTLPKTRKKGKQKVLLCYRARKSRHYGEMTHAISGKYGRIEKSA